MRPPLLLRALLRLYPRDFRGRFGGEVMESMKGELEGRSGLGRAWVWSRGTADRLKGAIRERRRDWNRGGGMGGWAMDLQQAFRALRRSPGLTGAALVTLALGIGATTALFSVLNGIILRPLPYGDPDRVEPGVRSLHELDSGDGLFVGVDLGVDDAGAVIERGVDEPTARR